MSKAGYTSHGHEIPGAAVYPPERPPVARCGGPALCAVCARESATWQAKLTALTVDLAYAKKIIAEQSADILSLNERIGDLNSVPLQCNCTARQLLAKYVEAAKVDSAEILRLEEQLANVRVIAGNYRSALKSMLNNHYSRIEEA